MLHKIVTKAFKRLPRYKIIKGNLVSKLDQISTFYQSVQNQEPLNIWVTCSKNNFGGLEGEAVQDRHLFIVGVQPARLEGGAGVRAVMDCFCFVLHRKL